MRMGVEALEKLLKVQEANLEKLEKEIADHFRNYPGKGHGGSPIVDNSKGRARRRELDRYNDKIRSLNESIKEQKAKIGRTENRIDRQSSVTKQSEKFTEKNPISPLLEEMEKDGKVKRWARNPHIFFVTGLERVALTTVKGEILNVVKFPVKNKEERELCLKLIADYTKA